MSRLPGKRARPVLRGPRRSNAPGLPAEIYFSVVQRKVVAPNDFTNLDQIRERLAAFEARYNAVARPFNWKFTRRELENLLHRVDTHDNPAHPQRQAA